MISRSHATYELLAVLAAWLKGEGRLAGLLAAWLEVVTRQVLPTHHAAPIIRTMIRAGTATITTKVAKHPRHN